MGCSFKAKCEKCGLEGVVRIGQIGKQNFEYYGCPNCQKLITIDWRNTDKEKIDKIKKGLCPICGKGGLIDYRRIHIPESVDKNTTLCPKCKTYNLKLKIGLIF